ncbi:MAG: hypothetical protein PUK59_03010 [Actinomycetaceae bacterium]|nr:hypothetical protein [Actinomycetaceae bacterium]MDY5854764.1 hypothetical protein [Arcanobacterium sp.]
MTAFIIVCASLVFVTPSWRRFTWPTRTRSGPVDQAVILDLAASALKAGVSIPSMLYAVHQAMDDPAISVPGLQRQPAWRMALEGVRVHTRTDSQSKNGVSHGRTLQEVANLLLMGATWEEAWEQVLPSYQRLAGVLAPAWNDGVAPVALLERGVQELRFSRARRAKEAAARLGSLLVIPLSACFLPAFILIGVLPVVVAAAEKLL